MGTPDFAVPSLEILLNNNHHVVGVVTVADKPAGRGYKLQESAVKKAAVKHGLPVLQPVDLKSPDFLKQLTELKIDLIVIVAFRKLPKEVWAMPPKGTFNLHGSLLPNYRGAAPLNWAVINGEQETGVTTFFLDEKIDTGELIDSAKIAINENDTVGDIHDALMEVGAELVLKTVESINDSSYTLTKQGDILKGQSPKLAPKIFKENCKIDWAKPSTEIHNLIRGLSPYPAAYSELESENGKTTKMKIFLSKRTSESSFGKIGEILTDDKTFINVVCDNNEVLSILELQPEGKKRMKAVDYLRGNKISNCFFK